MDEQFWEWLDRGLKQPGKKPADLARKLKLTPDKVTKMRKRGGRAPKANEIPIIENFLGEKSPYSANEAEMSDEFDASLHQRPTDGILEIDVRAGLGGGGFIEGREVRHDGDYADPVKSESWKFPARFMREELRAPENRVIILETDGDSMSPTIQSGERVIVDTGARIPSPDGIFALRDTYGSIVVKRLQVLRKGDPPRILVISDNKSHPQEEVGADEISIVGRVLYGMKRL